MASQSETEKVNKKGEKEPGNSVYGKISWVLLSTKEVVPIPVRKQKQHQRKKQKQNTITKNETEVDYSPSRNQMENQTWLDIRV